jgi:hypothetical protein
VQWTPNQNHPDSHGFTLRLAIGLIPVVGVLTSLYTKPANAVLVGASGMGILLLAASLRNSRRAREQRHADPVPHPNGTVRFRYLVGRTHARRVELVLAVLAAVGLVGSVIAVLTGDATLQVEAIMCWPALAFVAYRYLLRDVYDLAVVGDSLTWRTPLRSGKVPVSEIYSIRPRFWPKSPEALIITISDGTQLSVMVRKGLPDFVDALVAAHPGILARSGLTGELWELWPGSSHFSRD